MVVILPDPLINQCLAGIQDLFSVEVCIIHKVLYRKEIKIDESNLLKASHTLAILLQFFLKSSV